MRRLVAVLIPALLVLLGVLLPVAPAGALPFVDTSCKSAPVPQMPGSGVSGWIDGGSPHPDMNKTLSAGNLNPQIYDVVEYPPSWHTYDTGCTPDFVASIDTLLGNWEKGFATTIVALCDSLHRYVAPPTFLDKLDPLLIQATTAVRDALFTPWVDVSILILGLVIIITARRRDMAGATQMVVWALFVLGVVAAVVNYPLRAGHALDNVTVSTVGQLNSSMLGQDKNNDPSAARANLLTDAVLYRQWLYGELGSADSPIARQYGVPLLLSQSYTYAEAARIHADPKAAGPITAAKQKDFTRIAEAIHQSDQDAYNHLKGQSGSRFGFGAITLFAAFSTAPFMIMADLLVVGGLLIIRFCVIALPGIGPLALHHRLRLLMVGLLGVASTALLNVVAFALGGAVVALGVGTLLGSSTGLPEWLSLLLCLIMTVIAWRFFRPARHLGTMFKPGKIGGAPFPGAWSAAKKVGLAAVGGVVAGRTAAAAEDHDQEQQQPPTWVGPMDTSTETFTVPDTSTRDVTEERALPPEEWVQVQPESVPAGPQALPPGDIVDAEIIDEDVPPVYRVYDSLTGTVREEASGADAD